MRKPPLHTPASRFLYHCCVSHTPLFPYTLRHLLQEMRCHCSEGAKHSSSSSPIHFPPPPFIFPVIHYSYGWCHLFISWPRRRRKHVGTGQHFRKPSAVLFCFVFPRQCYAISRRAMRAVFYGDRLPPCGRHGYFFLIQIKIIPFIGRPSVFYVS